VQRAFTFSSKLVCVTFATVKKLGRNVLIVLGAIAAFGAVILLALNLYVQSQGTQARIEQELSQRLGTPLRIQRMSVTPWGGLKLSGITIPQTDGGATGQFLEAKTFRLRIHFPSLFAQRLVVNEISLIGPHVMWLQNADGKWRLPPLQEQIAADQNSSANGPVQAAAPASQGSPPSAHAAAASPIVAVATGHATPPSANEESREDSFVPEIRRVNLVGGRFQFLDERAKVVAIFDDVQFHSNFRNAAAVRGNISIGKTSLRDRFFLQQLQARLTYDAAALEFSDISAKAGAGEITGRFNMQPQTADSPFTANVKFHAVQADRIVTDAGGPAGTISGRLEGYLDAAGKTADPNALAGNGEIVLRDGELRQYSLLDALGQVLQIDELRQLHFEQAQVKYHISPGVVTVDELLLRSPNIRLAATGTVSFDGKLRLESQLAINEQVRKQLFRAIRANFQPIEEPGFAAVNFAIGGTVERPKTDLMDKLVGRDLKDIGSVLGAFFGGKPDRPRNKKDGADASNAADAKPSAAPSIPAQPTATP
jgi:hypothetical protein